MATACPLEDLGVSTDLSSSLFDMSLLSFADRLLACPRLPILRDCRLQPSCQSHFFLQTHQPPHVSQDFPQASPVNFTISLAKEGEVTGGMPLCRGTPCASDTPTLSLTLDPHRTER